MGVPVMGRSRRRAPFGDRNHSIRSTYPTISSPGEHFALEVKGDSMIEAGILDGDTVVIRRPT